VLLRRDDRGVLAIGQPSHAWISGQLARAWGSDRFGSLEPREEVCLAAEQHDIGMAAWDLEPSRNPDTGLPVSFTEMQIPEHVELWTAGPRRLVRQTRYAALLVSMHGWRLYEHRDLRRLPEAEAAMVRGFLDWHRGFQQDLLASLRADPTTAASASEELIARNSQLLWTWDSLSLALCLDWAPFRVRDVPTEGEPVTLDVEEADVPRRLSLDPWPFAQSALTVRCEGQRLRGQYDSDGALRNALASAPWETIEFELVPRERK
jgi:hypothetical protein